jgi:hypothetical protein
MGTKAEQDLDPSELRAWRSADAAQRYRETFRAERIGPGYRGWLHFAFTTVVALGVIGWSAAQVAGATWLHWLTVPAAFVFANFAEYFGHRGPMHHRARYREILFRRHTQEHHRFFTQAAMACESPRDFKIMLFPPSLLVFFLGLLAAPIGALLFVVAHPNVGYLFVATAVGYYLTYEWLHFAYHLPPDSLVGRIGVVRVLRRHHATHHDPALMQRYNFNITFPIADWLMGTTYRSDAAPRVGS